MNAVADCFRFVVVILRSFVGKPQQKHNRLLRSADPGRMLSMSRICRPEHEPGSPASMATELGLRSVAFEVDDLQAIVERLAEDGYGLVGGVGDAAAGY